MPGLEKISGLKPLSFYDMGFFNEDLRATPLEILISFFQVFYYCIEPSFLSYDKTFTNSTHKLCFLRHCSCLFATEKTQIHNQAII
jgi:hypothetical protein